MPSIGLGELIVILVIALIIFGPGKLPSVGNAVGKALNEFKKASRELTKEESAPAQASAEATAKSSDIKEN